MEGFFPGDLAVVAVSCSGVDGEDDAAGGFEFAGGEGAELIEGVTGEELGGDSGLHVGGHGLEGLFADFGEEAALVDHAAELSSHAERAGLAGVFGKHRADERVPPRQK